MIHWLLIIGLINLILLLISLKLFLPNTPIVTLPQKILPVKPPLIKPLLIILGIVSIHLIEVNLIDTYLTTILSTDYATLFTTIEGTIVQNMSTYWSPIPTTFFVLIYIAIYPFTLWYIPLYSIITTNKHALNTLAYGLTGIYLITLPFYLFFPVSNVYTFFTTVSALETILPGVETFFYTTTTCNNCFPSLHTAITILIAYTTTKTHNTKLKIFTTIIAIFVIMSVIYLSIHWILDVIAGIITATAVIFIMHRWFEEPKHATRFHHPRKSSTSTNHPHSNR